ncbi:haspin protein kinase [Phlyctema vagabunda]|uniref:non-specific serine/threonine protein kinase n=1 Tax=Phlyctema vagabunda TaxID=108571 RepID=A0ABR4PNM1_9HELO
MDSNLRPKHKCLCCGQEARDSITSEGAKNIKNWAEEVCSGLDSIVGVNTKRTTFGTSSEQSIEAVDPQDLTDEEVSQFRMDASRRRNKTYGKKAPKAIQNPMFILGGSDLPSSKGSERSALDEVTNSLGNVTLTSDRNDKVGDDDVSVIADAETSHNVESELDSTLSIEHTTTKSKFKDDVDPITSLTSELEQHTLQDDAHEEELQETLQEDVSVNISRVPDDVLEALAPLRNVYEQDCNGQHMMILTWDDVLQESTELIKIAEASFAQVFRVKNTEGTSILKFVELEAGNLPAAKEEPTDDYDYQVEPAPVESVISEFRLMNALTEIPGFVNFKDAHIVIGKPPALIKQAYDHFMVAKLEENDEYAAYFPDPASYDEQAVFLFLELGDAGVALDDVYKLPNHLDCSSQGLQHVEWVWDVLLGVVLALARAEIVYKFEHRDLHQNNICLNLENAIHHFSSLPSGEPKLGRSGIRITILDYGLSRATLESGEHVYADLEDDLDLFRALSSDPMEDTQYSTYRKMRTHLFSGNFYAPKPPSWHTNNSRKKNEGHTWEDETPYSNVLWISYLYEFLCLALCSEDDLPYTSFSVDQQQFYSDTAEFRKKLVHSKKNNKRFLTAVGVMDYCIEKGWITQDQVEDFH